VSLERNTPISRGIAVLLLLFVLAVIYLLLVAPLLHHYRESRQELEHLTRQVVAYERIAESRSEVEKLFAAMHPEQETLGYYLKGGTKALASAELQTYVRTIIENAEGNLVSTQPMDKGEREPERMVKVNVRMSGNVESLLHVFYRIANGVPVLLTDEVLIRRNKSSLSRTGVDEGDDVLDIQFTLTGFVKESIL
jgi:general secretion pathway protein M